MFSPPSRSSCEVDRGSVDSALDTNLHRLLFQRQQMVNRGSFTSRDDDVDPRSPDWAASRSAPGYRVHNSYGEADLEHSSVAGAYAPFTPDRPTTSGAHEVSEFPAQWRGASLGDDSWIGERHRGGVNVSRQTGERGESFDVSQVWHLQHRLEGERQANNQRTTDLIVALDDARQDALLRQQEAQALRAALLDREDQLARLHCEYDLLASCYQRDRHYFRSFAQAALRLNEDASRREIMAKEAEWRMYTTISKMRDAEATTALLSRGAAPPASSSDCSVGNAHGDSSSKSPSPLYPSLCRNDLVSKEGSPRIVDGRFLGSSSESMNTSPRSHRVPATSRKPPLSPTPDEVVQALGPVENQGVGSFGRVMHCKANLLSEVSSAKRQLEGKLADAEGKLTRLRGEAVMLAREHAEKIAELEHQLSEEKELTADMQLEIDDMIQAELWSQETQGRLRVESEASEAYIALIFAVRREEAETVARERTAPARETATWSSWPASPSDHVEGNYRCSDGEAVESETPTSNLRGASASSQTERGSGPFPAVAPFSVAGQPIRREGADAGPSIQQHATGPTSTPTAPLMSGKELLRQLLSSGKRPLGGTVSSDVQSSEGVSGSPQPLESLLRQVGVEWQKASTKVPAHTDATLPPLSPTSTAGRSTAGAQRSASSDALEVLTPVTSSFSPGSPPPFYYEAPCSNGCLSGQHPSETRSTSKPLSATSQGVSPEMRGTSPDDGAAVPLSPQPHSGPARVRAAEAEHSQVSLPGAPSDPVPTTAPIPFDMPRFLAPPPEATSAPPEVSDGSYADGTTDADRSRTHAGAKTGGGSSRPCTVKDVKLDSCASFSIMKAPGEELFQPQALSFSAIPSHVWDIADSDDESIPTPPAGNSHAHIYDEVDSPTDTPPLHRCRRMVHLRNPYDDDCDEK